MNGPYLLVADDFVRTGGMDMANYALASYLAEAGVEVHLVAYSASEALRQRPNVRFHQVREIVNSHFLSSPLLEAAGRRHARRIARRGGRVLVNGANCHWSDLNWVHYLHALYRPQVENSMVRRIKCKYSHSLLMSSERRALAMARIVIANSEGTRSEIISRLGVPAGRVHTVYYGIDPDLFRPHFAVERAAAKKSLGLDDSPAVMFIGAMSDRRKGFDTVYAAWARLCTRPSWRGQLVVVGVGSEVAVWQRRAMADGLAGRVRFLGFRSDVPEILAAADALVAPTRYEAYGLAVHEALCCGVPAFVTKAAGVAEQYPRELHQMLLEDPNDPEELVAALTRWADDCDGWRSKVTSFAELLRKRTWRHMAADILKLAENVN